ncbi:MAG: LD-carboxypeptidase [Deltaproteobacteria bacterium]|jgi:muramoyltetrapeptide carboxypeptidase
MKAPRFVEGGRIGVFAPASAFDPERFKRGVSTLEGLGFEVVLHPQLALKTGFLAGADDARIDAFLELLADDSIDALIAARGGYGVHRLLPRLDPAVVAAANKPIVGFSDLSALHAVAQRGGLVSYHGPVVTQLGDLSYDDHAALVDTLAGRWSRTIRAAHTIVEGVAEGPLIGGCLSVLTPLLGTPYLPPLDGAILVLEDVGEPPYRIDRQLTHLELAGVFDRVAGIAVGEFVNCRSPREGEQSIDEVLDERLGRWACPVVAGLPFGHGTVNLTLPLGAHARLDAAARTLTVASPT